MLQHIFSGYQVKLKRLTLHKACLQRVVGFAGVFIVERREGFDFAAGHMIT